MATTSPRRSLEHPGRIGQSEKTSQVPQRTGELGEKAPHDKVLKTNLTIFKFYLGGPLFPA